jgi:hydrogenase maturation factor
MSEDTPACVTDHEGCITCGDHAVEVEVMSVDEPRGLALCADATGAAVEVDALLVAPIVRGERLLVHAGTAIAVLDGLQRPEADGRSRTAGRDAPRR